MLNYKIYLFFLVVGESNNDGRDDRNKEKLNKKGFKKVCWIKMNFYFFE